MYNLCKYLHNPINDHVCKDIDKIYEIYSMKIEF